MSITWGMRAASLVLLLALGPRIDEAPLVRVTQGTARLLDASQVRTLDRVSPSVRLASESGWVESGARTALELAWRGEASAALSGPAAFGLTRRPGLALERVQTAEIEVRRGTLALTIEGLGALELGSGALQVRSLPDGVFELTNRGGHALELHRADQGNVRIASGERVRLRAAPGPPGSSLASSPFPPSR